MELSVQYGCGFSAPDGWTSFDASPTLRFERIPVIGKLYTKNGTRFPEAVRYGDIIKGLPLAPNSVARLYASHVLEHLSYQDALQALRHSFDVLQPGGRFRLIVPDLHERTKRYLAAAENQSPAAAHDFMRSSYLGAESRSRSLAGRIQEMLGNSRHLWMWDEASMAEALRNAGFVNIRRASFGDSGDTAFAAVEAEDRFISEGIVEMAIDCQKPAA